MSLHAGDLVQVRSAQEILATLDQNGALDSLVFMPEMLDFCGSWMRVRRGAMQVCTDNARIPPGESRVRHFLGGDVFVLENAVLENARCSGEAHGACQRGCTLFWKERWLRKITEVTADLEQPAPRTALPVIDDRLITASPNGEFYCQSSQLIQATRHLAFRTRLRNCMENVRAGNYTWTEMLGMLATWIHSRVQRKLRGTYPRGACEKTPEGRLDLQPGEWVRVKSLAEIVATLDGNGKNRGLHFSHDMIRYCGKRLRVRTRAENLIGEGTGRMWHMRNTVILEDAVCDAAIFAFGGCPRDDYLYWREAWLRRIAAPKAFHSEANTELVPGLERQTR